MAELDWVAITKRNARSVQTTIGWIFWDPGAVARYEALTKELDDLRSERDADSNRVEELIGERQQAKASLASNPLAPWIGSLGSWNSNPAAAFRSGDSSRVPGVLTFANCCRPIPGDAIIAHISPGKGLVIHQESCRNIKGYSREPDKYLPVQWEVDKEQEQEFRTGISIEIVNHQGALAELANVIAATGANIHAISTEEKDGRVYVVTLLITTKSRIHLANIMRKIRVMPNVLRVSRQKN